MRLSDALPPWPIPDTFDASPDEIAQSKLLTPYRALASAVRHEERAFAFWTYVAAHADKTEVKCDRLPSAWRSKSSSTCPPYCAGNAARHSMHSEERLCSQGDGRTGRLICGAQTEERRVAELVEQDPKSFLEVSEFAQIIVRRSKEAASKLDTLEAIHHPTLSLPRLPTTLNDDPLAISELLVEAYLSLADSSKNSQVVYVAQHLAGAAIYRLATLRAGSDSGV